MAAFTNLLLKFRVSSDGRDQFGKLRVSNCCRKGNHFQGLRVGSCLTLGNESSKETHVLTKQKTPLGRGTRVESRRARQPGGLLCRVAHSVRFYGDRISF